jgi:hypothetical protein
MDDTPTNNRPMSHSVCPLTSVRDNGGYDVHPALAAPPGSIQLDEKAINAGHINH